MTLATDTPNNTELKEISAGKFHDLSLALGVTISSLVHLRNALLTELKALSKDRSEAANEEENDELSPKAKFCLAHLSMGLFFEEEPNVGNKKETWEFLNRCDASLEIFLINAPDHSKDES